MNRIERFAPWGYTPAFDAGYLAECDSRNLCALADDTAGTPLFDPADVALPGRIVRQDRDRYEVLTLAPDGRLGAETAVLTGRSRHMSAQPTAYPCVGDWVLLEPLARIGGEQLRRLAGALPRASLLVRKGSGRAAGLQAIAANLDVAFVAIGLDGDFNARRLERYLEIVNASGARPVALLTKADIHDDDPRELDRLIAIAEASSPGVPVHAVSAKGGGGMHQLAPYLTPGGTVCVIGSSGVGKSTLLNRLAGYEIAYVNEVRKKDDRGQHTTTAREIHRLPDGALLVDTPGMRELGLIGANDHPTTGSAAFRDLEALASTCRFNDCTHHDEPGCAVRAAIDAGDFDAQRLDHYQHLEREAAHQRRRENIHEAHRQRAKWKAATQSYRARTQHQKRERGG